jgi:hypothetical protein
MSARVSFGIATAPQTERLRLGLLVTSNRFGPPALLARIATTAAGCSTTSRAARAINAGYTHIVLGLSAPYPPAVAHWVAGDLINASG